VTILYDITPMNTSSDYNTVARAIRFLRDRYTSQPSLDEIAEHVGLSPFHFQRVFSRWAGVSPKRFLQHLTVQHVKDRLKSSESVLQAAFSAGLSGPARLHDLLISTTAVTPGEYKAGGRTLEIRYGTAETPFGMALLGNTPRGLCHLSFLSVDDPGGSEAISILEGDWPEAVLVQDKKGITEISKLIFRPGTQGTQGDPTPLSLLLKGTNFQIRVWEALLRIPDGSLTTYGRLARAMDRSGAARAVGGAVGRNSIAYLIPCHRVIREEGTLGGYRWGEDRKAAALGWEAARAG
jgi:AraC family transcriptional regulator of adaptative response/methylated-DNA-[protein]-cysteine methyltransferase